MSDDDGVRNDIAEIREALVEHRVRLENGVKVFGDFKDQLDKLKPKAPDWLKLLGFAVGLFGMAVGGIWWVADAVHDRPTVEQLEHVLDVHEERGHPKIEKTIQALREDTIRESSAGQEWRSQVDSKLDRILGRRTASRAPAAAVAPND
jgi:hypothetical protein